MAKFWPMDCGQNDLCKLQIIFIRKFFALHFLLVCLGLGWNAEVTE